MKVLFVLTCLWAILFVSCSNSENLALDTSAILSDDKVEGMLRVASSGMESVVGTDKESARANERPMMKTRFDYDFSIGRHEVTCGEFNSLMKKETGLVLACEKENLPATDLTYYDAVLFANARSKAEDLDTVYTYSEKMIDESGHCSSMEGFAYHPDVNGFRLPTEAEWMLVAKLNWNPEQAWTAENSDFKLHEVCSKANSGNEVCDMVGNAMEWVNDWLGSFRDTTIVDYVGAPDGGSLGERVVKGGSYRVAAENMTSYSRGDVYTVTSSTRAVYVGFRLALGAIPNAAWLRSDGMAVMNRVVPLAGASEIHSLMETYRVKLAFRNDLTGNLSYIDYSSGILSVTEIVDALDVYHPEISPDGKKVAFCTGIEGISGKSSLYVRDLNKQGSNLVQLDVESAVIPRWRVLGNGDTVIVYVTDAGNNKEESVFKGASTWQVKFANGKFGTPEKLFDGAYHGGISEDSKMAVTGARLLRARVSGQDTVWYNGEQACNVSLAQDSSKRTLFLDFGGKTGREFVGERYGTHERLLVADSRGKLIQSLKASEGYAFDHSEWVRGRNMVVATFSNALGAHTKVVVANLDDGKILDLLEGEEVWHPSLWVDPHSIFDKDASLDLDSAGIYLKNNDVLFLTRFRIKMEIYWKYLERTNVILAGSSRIEGGMNPDQFPEWNMINLGVMGIDPLREYYLVENYMLNHADNLKAIVLSLDIDNWHGIEDHLSSLLSAGPGYSYDANHDFWKDGIPRGFIEAVENSFPPLESERNSFSERGNFNTPVHGWESDGVEILNDSIITQSGKEFIDSMLARLQDIVDRAAEHNVYIIGVIFPQAPQYKRTGSMGLYGLQRSVAKGVIAKLDSIDHANKYFVLMDENKMGNHDYSDDMANNRDHLSYLGAQQITARLDSVLRTLKW